MATVRAAVIGCGDHGRRSHVGGFLKAIEAGEDAELVAVCDLNPDNAKAAASDSPGTRWYTDYREMIAEERPSAVSVASPPSAHCEQVVAALESGAAVVCEKPLAMSASEAKQMVAASERTGRSLMMGLQSRYHPGSRHLREMIARGELGKVYHTRVWYGHHWNLPGRHFMRAALAGGGTLAASAVHFLDVALWIIGNPPVVTASGSTFAKAPRLSVPPPPYRDLPNGKHLIAEDDVEDFAYGLVRFADGSTLSVESNWLEHPNARVSGVEFLAEHGVAEFAPFAVRYDADGEIVDRTPQLEEPRHPFEMIMRDLCHTARTGKPSIFRGSEPIQVQAVMDAIYASARAGHEVEVEV